MSKRILFVEDDTDLQMLFVETIGDKAKVVCARTEEEAFRAFEVFNDFDLIMLDGALLHNVNSLEFGRHVRASGYTGPMVACSINPEFRQDQMQNGCDHECHMKAYAGRLALKLLGLS